MILFVRNFEICWFKNKSQNSMLVISISKDFQKKVSIFLFFSNNNKDNLSKNELKSISIIFSLSYKIDHII